MLYVLKLVRWINLALVLITFCAYLSPYLRPETYWPFAFLGIAYPWLLLLNLIAIGFWLFFRKYYWWYSLICIFTGWQHFSNFVGLHFMATSPGVHQLKVMTYNLNINNATGFANRESAISAANSFFTENKVDVLCLQEFHGDDIRLVRRMKMYNLNVLFSYKYKEPRVALLLLSKYPIMKYGSIIKDDWGNGCIYMDINVKGSIIRVYNFHLHSNKITKDADEVIDEKKFEDEKTWGKVRGIFGRVRRSSAIRADQAEKIAKHIQASPYPVIVCGDMNETPLSYAYHCISKDLKDGFREKGGGLGITFSGSIPALKIDYIFTDPRLTFCDFKILHKNFSDHYPVMGILSW